MLVRTDLLTKSRWPDVPYVAILRSKSCVDTLLRIAVYPDDNLVYCGLWLDEDLLLGWAAGNAIQSDARLFVSCRVEVTGRSDLEVRVLGTWAENADGPGGPIPVSADALITDRKGARIDRLTLSQPRTLRASCSDRGGRHHSDLRSGLTDSR